jgi:DNA-binding NtrC family response regulator
VSVRFLVVGQGKDVDTAWSRVLREALEPLGKVEAVAEGDIFRRVTRHRRGTTVVIVDTTEVNDVPVLLSRLRQLSPPPRVVVATASPTWRRARDALRLGAADYIQKTLDRERLQAMMTDILSKADTSSTML